MALSAQERRVIEHSLGPHFDAYRNCFVAGPGHHSWEVVQGLCARGLMRVTQGPGGLHGEATVFAVTKDGVAMLKSELLPVTLKG